MARAKYFVDLYYDVMSPFSWIGFEGLLRYQQIWPISIRFQPFWLREIFQSTGNKSPVAIPNKAFHFVKELELQNSFWGMNLHYPANFKKWIGKENDSGSKGAMKVILAVQQEEPKNTVKISREYWKRLWSYGQPIFSDSDHEAALANAGFSNPDYWMKLSQTTEIDEKLKENAKAALELKCFGAPWIVVHKDDKEHCFFGSDRFHLIAHLLGEQFTDGKKEIIGKI